MPINMLLETFSGSKRKWWNSYTGQINLEATELVVAGSVLYCVSCSLCDKNRIPNALPLNIIIQQG